ncbi:MAG: polyprenyl synthetase family protein [Chloroflexi bacterium]|nr:polyprenyl synthetase family protein [Chloroflexota bacterium]
MNIYPSIVDYLLNMPVLGEWNDAKTILNRIASVQPRDWRLPLTACEAVGGSLEQGIPASASLACAQIGIILVDDMLDDDPRGEYRRIGAGQAANLASAFLSAGSQAILYSQAGPMIRLDALSSLNEMILAVALGQCLDVQNPQDEDAYWRVVENKSAPFFGTAIHLGALFGGASKIAGEKMEQVGRVYGEMIQIHDDLRDTMETPANPDWTQGRSPLPILFARLVDHPDRTRFMELYGNIADEGTLQEAQEILIRCGAVSYCVDQLMRRSQSAEKILRSIPLVRADLMESLLEAVIAPVRKLFDAVR